jgi:SAM-dependent methyltransferase
VAETNTGIRGILAQPAIYDAWSRAVGGVRAQTILVRDYVRPWPRARVLDLGCGTGELLNYLGDVNYTGVDVSDDYIVRARSNFGDRGEFFVGDASSVDLPAGEFDLVLAVGVLHHLDDLQAEGLFGVAAAALKSGGRLITIDPTFVRAQKKAARFVIEHDRGRNVRYPQAYHALADRFFNTVRSTVRGDLIRIPYTHCLLECEHAKPG